MATLQLIADEIAGSLGRDFDDMFKERIKSIFRHEAYAIVRQAINKDGISDQFKSRFTASISIVDDSSIPCGSECGVIRTNKLPVPTRYNTDDPFTFIGSADGRVVYIYTKVTELPYVDLNEPHLAHPIRYYYQNGYVYIVDGAICGTVTSFADYSETVAGTILVTSTAHGLKTGHKITFVTPDYVSTYTITRVSADTFYITETYTSNYTGVWNRILDNDACISIEGVYTLGDVFASTPEAVLNGKILTDETELPLADDLIQTIKLKLLDGELSIIDDKDKIQPQNIDN